MLKDFWQQSKGSSTYAFPGQVATEQLFSFLAANPWRVRRQLWKLFEIVGGKIGEVVPECTKGIRR